MTTHIADVPPDAAFLSNGRYYTFVTAAGTGQSRRYGHVVNRWLGDPVEDGHGQFIYLRDLDSDEIWSIGRQPIPSNSVRYQLRRPLGTCEIIHECNGISAELRIAIPSDDDLELRQLTLENVSSLPRRIEVTSYFDAVLNWQGADISHPAFSKLFLQTEFNSKWGTLLINRRPRANNENWPTLFHALVDHHVQEWETDRLRFLGRGRTARSARGLTVPLSGTTGNVLDPCCVLRTVVELPASEERQISFVTGVAETKTTALETVQRYGAPLVRELVFTQATERERQLLTDLRISEEQVNCFQSLAAEMLYGDRRLVPLQQDLPMGGNIVSLFERLGIPRDRMLIVVTSDVTKSVLEETRLARQYWDRKGIFTNLLMITDRTKPLTISQTDDRFFTIGDSELSGEERSLLFATASLVIENQLPLAQVECSPPLPVFEHFLLRPQTDGVSREEDLHYFNGYGGFSTDGREYVIRLPYEQGGRKWPPLPWINVIANERAGFLITEAGASCTWVGNSQANRLTPWGNDPVSDLTGEALYVRDETTGSLYSPFPGPVDWPVDYEVRHGWGYSRFLSEVEGIEQEATLFVPRQDQLKVVLLRLTNRTASARSLSLTSYQQLVLGSVSERPSMIVSRRAPDGSLRAENLAGGNFRDEIAFALMSIHGVESVDQGFTCDRQSFLGRHRSVESPASLQLGNALDGAVGSGFDPCFALQHGFTLEAGATVQCVVLLGESSTDAEVSALISRYRKIEKVNQALTDVREYWTSLAQRIHVETPSPILNLLVNGWLTYQTLSCRIWARSGFYQSSGAYGFRDQLQDAGNLLPIAPRFAREQILLHARHQFVEGDVLHWWHPAPVERGVRTRFADDLLWLPLVTCDYLQATGEVDLLDVMVPFLTAPLLKEGEDEAYLAPQISDDEGTLYEHCCRAIDRSLAVGTHGLPLMGTGDWNDGMNRVGREGRGESVWMGFFLYRILGSFLPYCELRKDAHRVQQYTQHREHLYRALNSTGWDGEWYRRAYYDNGDPLGSSLNDECRIDAIAQAWAVISNVATPDRADLAMNAMSRELISETDGIIRLLAPPFVNTQNDPGYIKGYVAGIRENGGQYTHAACWAVMALALRGENDRAASLLEMLSPISHSLSSEAAEKYKLEPYSVPGDVYGAPPHVGRGGWSWYTGSSGWMYRVAIESILGIRVENDDTLVITPCIPGDWKSYRVRLKRPRHNEISYDRNCEIVLENSNGSGQRIISAMNNGVAVPISGNTVRIPLNTNMSLQRIHLELGS